VDTIKKNHAAGQKKQYGPRPVGEILHNYLENSNEPLPVAYREHKAEAEVKTGQLFKDFYPDTHLDIDLKLITREQGRMSVGAYLDGVLTRDGEAHFCFIQNDAEMKKLVVIPRNPHIYLGKRINVNRKDDGTLYPTFNRPSYTKDFSFQDFCREAAEELLVVAGLIKEESVTE
jgi:hypothetical protein